MRQETRRAIRTYLSTVRAHQARYNLACRANLSHRWDRKFCVASYHPMVCSTFRSAMKAMYKEYNGTNMYYKNQLLRAALGLTSIEVSPSTWAV